jgi:predicted nucleic acid-binding protein
MNGLTYLIEDLKKHFKGKFIITQQVKYETIDRPLNIKRFELSALKINKLLEEKVLELPSSMNITEQELREKIKEILRLVNHTFSSGKDFMEIIHNGEASCLALSLIASERKIENIIVIDERTTRMLGENPENLRKLFENKLHTKIQLKQSLSFLNKIKFIRSSELVYIAYKKGLVKLKNDVLDALLYAVKYKGCSISTQEIEDIKRLKL